LGRQAGALLEAGQKLGLVTASEVFADRGYAADGSLLPRGVTGAVISEPDTAARRAASNRREGAVELADGSRLGVAVDTICVHGDTPNSVEIARRMGELIKQGGIE
jgi:UPF0271 protein